ncbi:CMKLR1 [Mytilus edulis]|uniref:CMKLR1 n=1 Tax=Mytilus edulis TaxID=6550 RepID=A0A8S3U5V3_MYTED|nr:CMKLR1 [Mytilus edulis]
MKKYITFLLIGQIVYEEKGLSKDGITSIGESPVMFSFEDDKCVDNFVDFVALYGHIDIEHQDFLVSPSNINEFHRIYKCLDFRIPCFGERYDDNFLVLPPKPAAIAGSVLSIVIIVVNTYVMFVFLQTKNRSPMVIMLSAIALTDMLTAVFVCTPMTIPYLLYDRQITFSPHYNSWLWLSYNYVTFILWTESFEISNIFHMASIFITTALCVQRAVSMLFPIWSKIHITNQVCVYTSIVLFGYSFILNTVLIICHLNLSLNIDGILCIDYERLDILEIESYTYLLINISYISSCILMVVCSFYIACKLTLLRENLKWVDSQEVQKRNRRSAFIVVVISVICTVSEAISIMTLTFYFATDEQIDKFIGDFFDLLYPYQQLSITIGFFCNFFAYLFMGTQLRETIYESFKRVINCLKCKW